MGANGSRGGFGWGRLAALAAAGGAAVGGVRAARRALMPPDQRPHGGAAEDHAGHAPEPFAERYRDGLGDDRMRAGLLRFQRIWRASRDSTFADFAGRKDDLAQSFEALRDQLAAVKDRVIADPDPYFAQFKALAERNGAIIYESSSAEDANRYIAELCRRKGVKIIDKSKSMASE